MGHDLGLEPPTAEEAPELGPPKAMQIRFSRKRPFHPERFFAFVRRCFGPLDLDLPWSIGAGSRGYREQKGAGNADVQVRLGSGCLWFIGSDDVRAEWFFDSTGAEGRKHLIRCGEPWEAPGGGATEAGVRRVDVAFEVRGSEAAIESWKANVFGELSDCLITREEAIAFEEGDMMLLSDCEWEDIRTGHEKMYAWVLRWWHVLHLLHGITSMVRALPGFDKIQSAGRSVASRVRTAWQPPPKQEAQPLRQWQSTQAAERLSDTHAWWSHEFRFSWQPDAGESN
mmetsp:Transcript_32170/g.60593  ORF Transcript_32170/g.60593 Transcript_32170/m.60593 type:complete len:284 (-) Transcript_32170:150-1001(-)